MDKLKNVINALDTISDSLTGVQFVSLPTYSSEASENTEEARYVINVGVDYGKAKEQDIETLKTLEFTLDEAQDKGFELELLNEAQEALLAAALKPKKDNPRAQAHDVYTHISNGLKYHEGNNELYVFGQKISKKVLVEGEKKEDTRRPLTKAKDYIRNNYLKTSKYRQFKFKNVESLKVNGETLQVN